MEPLAIQSGVSQTVKPVLALNANLTAVLQEGRMVAGEVLQTLDGRSLLIGVGLHRVPAESHVELQAGDRFLARVEEHEGGTVLRVLGGRSGSESKLLIALRSVVGEELPLGQLLEDLASSLRAAIKDAADPDSRLVRLLKSVGEHLYTPGTGGEELRALLSRAGYDHEARLLAAVLRGPGTQSAAELARALSGELAAELAGLGTALGTAELEKLGALLKSALERYFGAAPRSAGAPDFAGLKAGLLAALTRALQSSPPESGRDAQLAQLSGALAKLLGDKSPTGLGRQLLAALPDAAAHQVLAGNLKARLLGALIGLADGPAREAITRALAGIESEQLFNLARKEFNEGWHLSLPVPDGDRWATAHLFYRDSLEQEGDGQSPADGLQRLTLSIDFTRLGPLRADIGINGELVAVRLTVTRPETAERLRAGIEELGERLAIGGRRARATVILGAPEEVEVEADTPGIRWLQEHRLMDLSG